MMKKKNICVIGAGIGGITAARTLKKKGHSVTVFEKENRIGGKCYTRYENGKPYEMGAIIVTPSYRQVIKLAREVGVRFRNRAPNRIMSRKGEILSFRKLYWPARKTIRILYEMLVYFYHACRFSFFYDRSDRYREFPADYELSFRDFCKKKNLTVIGDWLELAIVSFGYGDLRDIRTWYVLHYVHAVHFFGIAFFVILFGKSTVKMGETSLVKGSTKMFEKGYGHFVETLARDLDVRLNTEIAGIDRGESGVTVRVKQLGNNPEKEYFFDSLVLAVPLSKAARLMEFNENEQLVSDSLSYCSYVAVACEITGIPTETLLISENAKKEHFDHICLITKGTGDDKSSLHVCYTTEKNENRSKEEILATLKQDIEGIGGIPGPVRAFKKWKYFPQFKERRMYKYCNDMQGEENVYYVGGMTKFESVESAAAQAEALVDKNFPGTLKKEYFTTIKNFLYLYHKHDEKQGAEQDIEQGIKQGV
ncbi:MAG: FAD-dependent oxidoreductase [bacterium]|nr:FAD-dependent oxidoreductase [bacterium]